jgi:SRSO17 transposase
MLASRDARPTIRFVDEYCQLFEELFPEVKSYEAFKLLHLGMISEVKRKSLPAIALISRLRQPSELASLSQ